ncbi:DUF5642 family protein [Mycobacterium sp.]|uniref:DUF5642 family protein n=1 Tax=Mycobacterium sp. TaxID=1785 RepID=UPI002B945F6D|nr:DUF5642 family protein [Mycobacterium sp.]HTQ16327.1 DUF5642 family protein [Mycobacterium sp.]
MRPFWIGPSAISVVLVAACSPSPAPSPQQVLAPSPSPSARGGGVNPANIKRIGRELPPGYEVSSGIPPAASPRVIWGLKADAARIEAKPAQCAALADPGNGRGHSAQGVSGSGSGGIVDAIVVALPALPGPVTPDHSLLAACGQWTMADGRTSAGVHLVDPPHIDGAETVGMAADIRTTVESGTEIDSRAYTFVAYLGNYYAFTTVTIDPGSALPALTPQFAADLLVKTASTLRS